MFPLQLSELLFDVILTAYERTSLMVTTNLPFERWVEVLGSERLSILADIDWSSDADGKSDDNTVTELVKWLGNP